MKLTGLFILILSFVLPVMAEEVSLELIWTEGKKYKQHQIVEMTSETKAGETIFNSSMHMELFNDVNFKKHKDGTKVVTQLKKAIAKAKMNNNALLEYDSSDAEKQNPEMAKAYDLVLNKDISIIVKDQKVHKVEGVEDNEEMRNNGFDHKTLAQVVQIQLDALPNKSVKVGETWKKEVEVPLGGLDIVMMDMSFTLDSLDKKEKTALIRLEGSLDKKIDINGIKTHIKTKKYAGTMLYSFVEQQFMDIHVDMHLDANMNQFGTLVLGAKWTQTFTPEK